VVCELLWVALNLDRKLDRKQRRNDGGHSRSDDQQPTLKAGTMVAITPEMRRSPLSLSRPMPDQLFPDPPHRPPVAASTVISGPPIAPAVRIRTYHDREWEEFVEEWVHSLRDRYARAERVGGAGDMGRDVVATKADGGWDNYQCKHYARRLCPATPGSS
jgi:hypothetical protein